MVEHIRYEAVKLHNFASMGNGWIFQVEGLPDGFARFASESMLEAGAIHLRNLVEFLQDPTRSVSNRVWAGDYVDGWNLTSNRVSGGDYQELHARVAHLQIERESVASDGDFDWSPFLARNLPRVMHAFRDFLLALTPERREKFNQPHPGLPYVDLLAAFD